MSEKEFDLLDFLKPYQKRGKELLARSPNPELMGKVPWILLTEDALLSQKQIDYLKYKFGEDYKYIYGLEIDREMFGHRERLQKEIDEFENGNHS